MPRLARSVALSYPHHVIQRGNNRENVFFEAEDRRVYSSLLCTYSAKWNSPILAYCLMTNHVHLLTRPLEEGSLAKMMQGVTLCYSQHVNRTYGRTGRLWECRYHSCIVELEPPSSAAYPSAEAAGRALRIGGTHDYQPSSHEVRYRRTGLCHWGESLSSLRHARVPPAAPGLRLALQPDGWCERLRSEPSGVGRWLNGGATVARSSTRKRLGRAKPKIS